MKTKMNEKDDENDDEKIKEWFWNWFLKQSKVKKESNERRLMVANYQLLY